MRERTLLEREFFFEPEEIGSSFADFLERRPEAALRFQRSAGFRLLVLQKAGGRRHRLLHDGRHVLPAENPLVCWMLDPLGGFSRSLESIREAPKISLAFFRDCPDCSSGSGGQGLAEALPPPSANGPLPPSPQDSESLQNFLSEQSLWDGYQISVAYQLSVGGRFRRKPYSVPWMTKLSSPSFGGNCEIVRILAHPDRNLGIVYHPLKPLLDPGADREGLPHPSPENAEKDSPPDPFARNRSSAVVVKLHGLNLARKLGLLAEEEFLRLSRSLSRIATCLSLCFDDRGHARFWTVASQCGTEKYSSGEICCESDSPHSETERTLRWERLFRELAVERKRQKLLRAELLGPLLERLSYWTPGPEASGTLHSRCREQLDSLVNKHLILVCSDDDSALHALKAPLSCYLNWEPPNRSQRRRKRRSSFLMKTAGANLLLALSSKELVAVNVARFYEGKCVEELLVAESLRSEADDPPVPVSGPSPPEIVHSGSGLRLRGERAACSSWGRFASCRIGKLWERLSELVRDRFSFDLSSPADFGSVPLLAFKSVWAACGAADPVYGQFPEKLKPAYEAILRRHCKGGFTYSCRDRLAAGDPLWGESGGPSAACVLELDINSSYGFAASRSAAPGGFCTGLVRWQEPAGPPLLLRSDQTYRHRSFEFRSVFYTLWLLRKRWGFVPAAAFSNFHSCGLFFVGKHPLDLAVADARGRLLLFNFDGQFCHGCSEGRCPSLPRYANDEPEEELLKRSRERDARISAWVESVNAVVGGPAVSYRVVSDCHSPGYSRAELHRVFERVPELAGLQAPYLAVEDACEAMVLAAASPLPDFFGTLRSLPPEVSFLAVIRGGEPGNLRSGGKSLGPCLFAFGEDPESGAKWRKRVSETLEGGGLLLSRDYAEHLAATRPGFRVTEVDCCLLFPRWNLLNRIFRDLVEARARSPCPLEARLLKNFVNYACGYFGLNRNRGSRVRKRPIVRLCSGVGRRTDLSRTSLTPSDKFAGREYYVRRTYPAARKRRMRPLPCQAPLPLFAAVIEYGKLRLLQVLDWLEGCSEPGRLRHLYTNVDNLIVALADPSLDSMARPEAAEAFRTGWLEFFGDNAEAPVPVPGGLKLVWQLGPGDAWEFSSCALQNWSVVSALGSGSEDPGRFRSNLLKDVTAREYHRIANLLLDGDSTLVRQTRALDRMAGCKSRELNFRLQLPPPLFEDV